MLSHEIRGGVSQSLLCRLAPDQEMYCDDGRFLWKTPNVALETKAVAAGPGNAIRGQGLLGRALSGAAQVGRRAHTGTSIALPHFRAGGGTGLCSFAGALPGQLRQIELDGTRTWTVPRSAFVAAESSVGLDLAPDGPTGDGTPVLGRFAGTGSLFVAAAGDFIDLNPADYGGVIHADAACLIAFDDGISFSHEATGKLIGKSRSPATLEGDGKVILQSVAIRWDLGRHPRAVAARAADEEDD